MTTNNKTVTEYEKGVELMKTVAKGFDPRSSQTGTSYFKGKERLCKVLNSKKGIRIEVNVFVPKAVEDKFKMVRLEEGVAKKKHLGTMKYPVIALDDTGSLKELVGHLVKSFEEPTAAAKEEPKAELPKVDLTKKAKAN